MEKGKKPSQFASEGIREDTDRKKTYPEMIFKQGIIQAHFEMLEAEELLRYNKQRTGTFSLRDKNRFLNKIIKLFGMIKEMIKKSKKLNENQQSIYQMIYQVECFNNQTPSVEELILFKNFLIFFLDELNLTNLLLPADMGFISKMEDEY